MRYRSVRERQLQPDPEPELRPAQHRRLQAKPQDDSTNFTTLTAAVSSMVTSTAQSDVGMFEANLRDERYPRVRGLAD